MKQLTLGMVAHVDAGKTTLSESLLYTTGTIKHQGRVDHKDTFLDYNTQEREYEPSCHKSLPNHEVESCGRRSASWSSRDRGCCSLLSVDTPPW